MCPKLKIRLNCLCTKNEFKIFHVNRANTNSISCKFRFIFFKRFFFHLSMSFLIKKKPYEFLLPPTNTFSTSQCLRTSALQRNCDTGARYPRSATAAAADRVYCVTVLRNNKSPQTIILFRSVDVSTIRK